MTSGKETYTPEPHDAVVSVLPKGGLNLGRLWWLAPIVWLAVFGAAALTNILLDVSARGAGTIDRVLELLSSWPLILLVIVLVFRVPLGELIRRITEMCAAGVNILASQPAAGDVAPGGAGVRSEKQSTGTEVERLRAEVLIQQRLRVLWWCYSVINTIGVAGHAMIQWLVALKREATLTELHQAVESVAPKAEDRQHSLMLLSYYQLIEVNGQMIALTRWGRRLAEFIVGTWRPREDYPGDEEDAKQASREGQPDRALREKASAERASA